MPQMHLLAEPVTRAVVASFIQVRTRRRRKGGKSLFGTASDSRMQCVNFTAQHSASELTSWCDFTRPRQWRHIPPVRHPASSQRGGDVAAAAGLAEVSDGVHFAAKAQTRSVAFSRGSAGLTEISGSINVQYNARVRVCRRVRCPPACHWHTACLNPAPSHSGSLWC